jgi:membrane-associated protease RseP (regulator of RpoE activity)
MRHTRILVILPLFLFTALTNAAEPEAGPVKVPFALLKTGHMTVQVKVNGKGPYTLIFDTGAPITLVNNKIAKEAGLLKGVQKPAFTLFGSMGEVKIRDLDVGGQAARDVAAVVMDHPTVEAISKAFGPIDGIVGFPFFARYKMTLDYQAKTMTFVPNGFKPPDVMQALKTALMDGLGGQPDAPKILAPAALWGMQAAKASDDEEAGVTVKEVLPNSPAARAGLQAGDRLLTLDGRWTDTLADLYTAAGYVKPGAVAPLVVKRGGKEIELKVKPAAGL